MVFTACFPLSPAQHAAQVLQALGRLHGGAALDGEDDVAGALAADDVDDPRPVEHALAAGAAHGRAGDLAAFRIGVGVGDVLGVEVDEAISDPFQPRVDVVAAEIGIAGVEVDADGRAT